MWCLVSLFLLIGIWNKVGLLELEFPLIVIFDIELNRFCRALQILSIGNITYEQISVPNLVHSPFRTRSITPATHSALTPSFSHMPANHSTPTLFLARSAPFSALIPLHLYTLIGTQKMWLNQQMTVMLAWVWLVRIVVNLHSNKFTESQFAHKTTRELDNSWNLSQLQPTRSY